MNFYNIKELEINIGLKNEYHLIQISDNHMINVTKKQPKGQYEEALRAEEVWQRQKKSFAEHYKEPYDQEIHYIPSIECINKQIAYINKNKPDLAILNGDIIDYYTNANYKALKKAMNSIKVPALFICGNHETPCDRYNEIAINNDASFQLIEFEEFQVIGLDDSTKLITKDVLKKLKDNTKNGKPTIISMHIPVMTKENKEEMAKYDSYFVIDQDNTDKTTKEFLEYIINEDSIKALLCGHCHGADMNYFTKGKMQIICSSGLVGYINDIKLK